MCWNKQSKISPSVVDNETPQTPWKSIIIVGCFTFCFAAQFTLYFSSMWPFLQILDNTANENFYGIIVSAYSLGQILSGPLVGLWATRTKSIVNPAHFCLMLSLTGNIIYVIASVLPSGQKEYILLARFFVGMGESKYLTFREVYVNLGSFSLYQGFASTASTHQDRSKALAITTGGIALGFSFGPAIQLLFTPLGFPGYNIYGKLWINM
jgi:ceroid-lipofuscinosis MFS transporter 7